MSISDQILEDGIKTAKAMQEIRQTLGQNTQVGLNPFTGASMASMAPPTRAPQAVSPRVDSNEKMLAAENESLKSQLVEMLEETKRLGGQLGHAYQLIEKFREDFAVKVEALNGMAFDVQHSVYEALGGFEATKVAPH